MGKGKDVAFSAAELKQYAAVAIARAGGVVCGMSKMNSSELHSRMIEQIKVQIKLENMITLPLGMTWEMIIPNHLLKENTEHPGKAEWRKWGKIKS